MAKSGPHRPKATKQFVKKGRNFIKNWRVYRKMTVQALAEAAEMSVGNLSALENMRQGHSDEGLAKLAKALKTTPGALLEIDPLVEGTGQFWPLWERASPEDRQFLTDMAARMVGGKK